MGHDADERMHGNGLTVPADLAQLAALRSFVATMARATGAPVEVVEQFELVASELATNVIQHSDAERLTVVFDRVAEGWIVDVSNADGIVELEAPSMPGPTQLSGRGLFLVFALMDSVDLVDVDGSRHIRCLKLAG